MSSYTPVIGLEIHVQLATKSKMFSRCSADWFGKEPNSVVCPVSLGLPGALPVPNKKAIEWAILIGMALNCKQNKVSKFDRKHYFYPDLPKGYQISQFDLPICENGFLEFPLKNGNKKVTIQRIHMEEDAGKNLHMDGFSLVNLNRACVPLIEIVSGPDMTTSEEAGAYLRSLYSIVTYIGICDGNLQEGNFRCDANVSIRPVGSKTLGTRTEIKNVNSFKFVEKAIDYEIARQIDVVEAGGKIVQETRTFDADRGVTISMRSKEEAHDYRYFPEPDLIPLHLDAAWVTSIKGSLPELPEQKKARYVSQYGLTAYDAGVLTSVQSLAQFFEKTEALLGADFNKTAKTIANLMTGEVLRLCNEQSIEIHQSKITPAFMVDLAKLVQSQALSSTGAKQVIVKSWETM
jgi:aspartyl-tRNA(Asn)/glutamyl-tRNA(Gln) amidotransferase subunit B